MNQTNLNAIDIFTTNKHSDYPEVVFSSLLTNIMNPEIPFVFKNIFLQDFLFACDFTDYKNLIEIKVEAEKSLGNAGSIDILLSSSELIAGIEVKIWDRSGKNTSSEGIPQLRRYAKTLKKMAINKQWLLIYIIPTLESKICLAEFEQSFEEYPENLKLIPWNSSIDLSTTFPKYNDYSIYDLLKSRESEVLADPISKWIFNSLLERIPNLKEEIPDPGRFPNKDELLNISKLGSVFNQLFKHTKRYPSSIHTTIGIPFDYGSNKTIINGNSLYGIRTTKAYYLTIDEKDSNLPSDLIEIEIFLPLFRGIWSR
jgi:hypothetical protein